MPAVDLDAPSRAVQLSVDDALVAVKEFGRGQQLQTLLVSVPAAAVRRGRMPPPPVRAGRPLVAPSTAHFPPPRSSQVGLAWVLAALHTLAAVVFATLDPLRRVDHGAFCRSPEDEACRAALAGGRLCDLPRDAWQWRAP